jgi:hypothetical protein
LSIGQENTKELHKNICKQITAEKCFQKLFFNRSPCSLNRIKIKKWDKIIDINNYPIPKLKITFPYIGLRIINRVSDQKIVLETYSAGNFVSSE